MTISSPSDPPPPEYDADDDLRRSIEFAYTYIRARIANGGPGWPSQAGEMKRAATRAAQVSRKVCKD
jgi:hypothetical protein